MIKMRKAVDVVLLPDATMRDKAIKLNAKLVRQFGAKILLHRQRCLPHVSLAMGCIDVRDIPSVARVLEITAREVRQFFGGMQDWKEPLIGD